MKLFSIIAFSVLALTSGQSRCNPDKNGTNCFKGKLEIKGPCLHYVVSVTEGAIDTSKVAVSWTDPQSGKVYHNVFTISNPCNFADSIKEGDTFYFTFHSDTATNCVRCLIYREVPDKQNTITINSKGCL